MEQSTMKNELSIKTHNIVCIRGLSLNSLLESACLFIRHVWNGVRFFPLKWASASHDYDDDLNCIWTASDLLSRSQGSIGFLELLVYHGYSHDSPKLELLVKGFTL